ncbi:hypothetical protein HDV04_002158 [Boothiomyces sp. JEL0838]|nr:hypothetical protein HDV04_002158 [Boothiomyces sp. JEL0838]
MAYRLLKLGSDLNLPNRELSDSCKSTVSTLSQSPVIPNDSEFLTHEFITGRDHMLLHISQMTHISKDFFLKMVESSTLLTFCLRAGYYFHHDFSDFEIKTQYWLDQAISKFPVSFADSNPANVLASLLLGALHFKLNRIKEGTVYLRHAVTLAKEKGFNNEESITGTSVDPEHIEEVRKFWWWMFLIDRNLEYVGYNFINDQDNTVLLPGLAQSGRMHKKSISIMRSTEWFTPSLPGLSICACRPVLNRIYGKALRMNYLYRSDKPNVEFSLIEATILDSLSLWYTNRPPEFNYNVQEIIKLTSTTGNVQVATYIVEVMFQFHLTRMLTLMPNICDAVLGNIPPNVDSLSAIKISLTEISEILTFFQSINPTFSYTLPLFLNYVFQTTVCLICIMKIGEAVDKVVASTILNKQLETLKSLSNMQQRGTYILDMISELISVSNDPKTVIKMYKYAQYDRNPLSNSQYLLQLSKEEAKVSLFVTRCNRKRPSCQGCELSKTLCEYPNNKNDENDDLHDQLVERIKRLESSISAYNVFGISGGIGLKYTNTDQSVHENEPLINPEELYIFGESLFSFAQLMCNISKDFFKKLLPTSTIYVCATRATFYSHQDNLDSITQSIYWQDKAKLNFGYSFSRPSLGNLLGCFLLSVLSLSIISLILETNNSTEEGLMYLANAIRLAKDLGINKEDSISKLSDNDQDREDIRNLWWMLVTIDQLLISFDKNSIIPGDNQVYLPGTYNKKFTKELGVRIISSDDWFTPSIRGLSFPAYKVLLTSQLGKAFKYINQFKDEIYSVESVYVLSILDDSISNWYSSLPADLLLNLTIISNLEMEIIDTAAAWSSLDVFLQYCFIKLIISTPLTYYLIEHDGNFSADNEIFQKAIDSSKMMSKILVYYLNKNPNFSYCNSFVLGYVFQAAIPLICALKMDPTLNELQKSLDVITTGLQVITQLQQRDAMATQVVNNLVSLPTAVEVVKCYKTIDFGQNPFASFVPSNFVQSYQ